MSGQRIPNSCVGFQNKATPRKRASSNLLVTFEQIRLPNKHEFPIFCRDLRRQEYGPAPLERVAEFLCLPLFFLLLRFTTFSNNSGNHYLPPRRNLTVEPPRNTPVILPELTPSRQTQASSLYLYYRAAKTFLLLPRSGRALPAEFLCFLLLFFFISLLPTGENRASTASP